MKIQYYITSKRLDTNRFDSEAQTHSHVQQLLDTYIKREREQALRLNLNYDDAALLKMAKTAMALESNISADDYLIDYEFIATSADELRCSRCGWIFKKSEPEEDENNDSTNSRMCSRCQERFEDSRCEYVGGGYDGYSKSNNALDAEDEGKANASQLAKLLRCSTTVIAKYLIAAEWHHTSKMYNRTNYYDEPLLIALAQNKVDELENFEPEEIEQGKALLSKLRLHSKKLKSEHFDNCVVDWIEWAGTRRRPKPHFHKATNVSVDVKGSWAFVHLPTGDMKKKLTTNGFSFRPR